MALFLFKVNYGSFIFFSKLKSYSKLITPNKRRIEIEDDDEDKNLHSPKIVEVDDNNGVDDDDGDAFYDAC